MKMRSGIYGVILITVLLTVGGACTSAGPTLTQPPAAVQAPKSTPGVNEWDALVKAAKAEKEVAVTASSIGDARQAIDEKFTGKYGITVSFTLSGRASELIQKISTQMQAGLYLTDITMLGGTSYFNDFQPLHANIPIESLLVLPEVKDPTKWRTGSLPFIDDEKAAISPAVTASPLITINTTMVKDGEIQSNYDLLDPKWKGKLVINDPTVSGNGSNWFSYTMLVSLGGRQQGEDYMKKLIAQEPAVLRDQRLQAEWVARGKYPVGLGLDQATVTQMVAAGAPIKFIKIKEGWPLTQGPWVVSAMDKAPHPNAMKLFLNWVLSKEGVETISYPSGYPSERTDVSNDKFDPIFVPAKTDVLRGKGYLVEKGKLLSVAGVMFKSLLQ